MRSNNNRAPPQHAGCGNNCRGSDIWPTIFALTTMSSDCTNLSLNPSTALFTLPRRPRWRWMCASTKKPVYTYICEYAYVYGAPWYRSHVPLIKNLSRSALSIFSINMPEFGIPFISVGRCCGKKSVQVLDFWYKLRDVWRIFDKIVQRIERSFCYPWCIWWIKNIMGGEFWYLKGPYDTWGIRNNYLEIIDARFRLILYNLISMMELLS